jgi:hypothetical protein
MALGFSGGLRDARATAIRDTVDFMGPGSLLIYAGVRPATGGLPGTALAFLPLPLPSDPSVSGAQYVMDAIAPATISNSGTASWFRVVNGQSAQVIDGDIGETGSGADMELDSVELVAGRLITIDNFIISEGNP